MTNIEKTAVLVFAERSDAHLAPPTNNFLNSFSPPQEYHMHLASTQIQPISCIKAHTSKA
jgi:hypothetical protein